VGRGCRSILLLRHPNKNFKLFSLFLVEGFLCPLVVRRIPMSFVLLVPCRRIPMSFVFLVPYQGFLPVSIEPELPGNLINIPKAWRI
jgi:hypothetical protein